MKLYSIKAYGNYGGGMAIVAAKNEGRARVIVNEVPQDIWNVRYHSPQSVNEIGITDGEERVLDHYETGE